MARVRGRWPAWTLPLMYEHWTDPLPMHEGAA